MFITIFIEYISELLALPPHIINNSKIMTLSLMIDVATIKRTIIKKRPKMIFVRPKIHFFVKVT